LKTKFKKTLREKASPRHVPAKIIAVPDIPYTLNMKKVESAVTNIIHGRPVLNRDALMNPECLDYYENLEGGHAGVSNNKQQAYLTGLIYSYVWDKLA